MPVRLRGKAPKRRHPRHAPTPEARAARGSARGGAGARQNVRGSSRAVAEGDLPPPAACLLSPARGACVGRASRSASACPPTPTPPSRPGALATPAHHATLTLRHGYATAAQVRRIEDGAGLGRPEPSRAASRVEPSRGEARRGAARPDKCSSRQLLSPASTLPPRQAHPYAAPAPSPKSRKWCMRRRPVARGRSWTPTRGWRSGVPALESAAVRS